MHTRTMNIANTLPKLLRRFVGQSDVVGIGILFCTLVFLSFVAGSELKTPTRILVAGEIAQQDVIADRNLLVEDTQATRVRKDQVAMLQPAVFEHSLEAVSLFRERIHAIFRMLNESGSADLEGLRTTLADEMHRDVSMRTMAIWSSESLQRYVTTQILPWLEPRLAEGVASDMRILAQFKGGILIRDIARGGEVLRTDIYTIPDLRMITSELTQRLKNDVELTLPLRRAILSLLEPLMPPTLTMHSEATLARANEVMAAVEPIFYHLQRGEVIVRQGDRVNNEQQLKMQSLFRSSNRKLHSMLTGGTLIVSVLLAVGFFLSPSGKPGRALTRKDLIFISVVLCSFALMAKGLQHLAPRMINNVDITQLAYSFPVAGAAGLCALIFSARRYCVMGLFLALFSTIMLHGDLSLFLFYFLSAMLSTWLVSRAQTRQSVAMSFFPLLFGLVLIGLGTAMLQGQRGQELVDTLILIVGNATVSIFVLFAFSPFLEMTFRYTTRLRLMELMSLEQPLLQELMVTAPGTYHHSLIVANMVEAGAKAIGANSLLCKVAALYHDIGKIYKPDYFIENQFTGVNRHDKLAPSMSALIILTHVKRGVELAEKHRLGHEIVDIIRQHHGTRCIRFFYQKAVDAQKTMDAGESVSEANFSYPGPRPQSKEAAIVMLADVVEASSRTLQDPTPARIRNHIYSMIMGTFSDGQLDESELTFKELHKISESFLRVLTGIFHHRIEYPDAGQEKIGQEKTGQDKNMQDKKGDATTNSKASPTTKGQI